MKAQSNIKDIRIFGLIWSAIFVAISLYPLFLNKELKLIPLIFALFLLIPSIFFPNVLRIPFKLWMKFGELMNKLISKIVLFIIFYLLITPIGFITRLFGSDFLNKKTINKKTFWEDRENKPDSMKYQY
ncbi:MAG: hypothetical protein GXO79_04575 [Chlorobi bacterium]|nr:hypothetical protein [Chlorobiota bacterium]